MVLISAHRCGAGNDVSMENTVEAMNGAIALGVDYVEFDVQRCQDGAFVLFHDDVIVHQGEVKEISSVTYSEFSESVPEHMVLEEALATLAGRVKAHIDLKFTSPDYEDVYNTFEVDVAQRACAMMGVGNFIITTRYDASVRAVVDWSVMEGLDIVVGLSIGGPSDGMGSFDAFAHRVTNRFPFFRFDSCGAQLVVSHHENATSGFHEIMGLPLLVWTVDDPDEMKKWLGSNAWMMTTNHPDVAMRIRDLEENSSHSKERSV